MALYRHASRIVILAMALLGGNVAHANLVTNGGFESGDFSGWTSTDPADIVVWNTAEANVFLIYQGGPFAGSFGAYLGSANPQPLSQSVATIVGQHYRLTYELANLPCKVFCLSGGNGFQVFIGGNSVSSSADLPASAFAAYSDDFVATSTSTTLSFVSFNLPAFFGLDDVSIVAIPEPSDVALLALGASCIGLARRRRKGSGRP